MTPAAAISAQHTSTRRRDVARAMVRGPRNSSVTAVPVPTRSIDEYSERFMVPNTTASAATGHH